MLLDTHVLLWLLSDDSKLGGRTRELILAQGLVHVSVASLWEIGIKAELGKLAVPDDLPDRVDQAGLDWLPVTSEHAWGSRTVTGIPHRDPFDRLLVAQAALMGFSLVTADRVLLSAELDPPVSRVDARV